MTSVERHRRGILVALGIFGLAHQLIACWRTRISEAWSRRELRCLCGIVVLALAMRIVWVVYAARSPDKFLADPALYVFFGKKIASGQGYVFFYGAPTAFYPVGYPAALGAVFALVVHTPLPDNLILAGAFFQVFLGTVTVVFAYVIAQRLFGVIVALLASLWIAVFPHLIFLTGAFLSETLFNFLVLAALVVLLWSEWPRGRVGRWRLLVFGAVLGASALVRPISLLLLPLLPAVWVWAGADWRRALTQTGLVLLATVAVIMPWSIRNIVVMKAPVIISTNVGEDLCIGHYAGATGRFAEPRACTAGFEGLTWPELETRRNSEDTRRAIKFAVHHPGFELRLLSRKAYWLWNTDHEGLDAVEAYGHDRFIDPGLRTALRHTADIFFYVTISLGGLGLLGFVLEPREPRRVLTLLVLLALAGAPLLFFGGERFHVPVIPYLCMAAAWATMVTFRTGQRVAGRAVIAWGGRPGH